MNRLTQATLAALALATAVPVAASAQTYREDHRDNGWAYRQERGNDRWEYRGDQRDDRRDDRYDRRDGRWGNDRYRGNNGSWGNSGYGSGYGGGYGYGGGSGYGNGYGGGYGYGGGTGYGYGGGYNNNSYSYSGSRNGYWYAPGYGYYQVEPRYYNQRWQSGGYFPSAYRNYSVQNPYNYGLRPAPRGYRYVHAGNNILLITIATGLISSVISSGY